MPNEKAILAGGCFWGLQELFRYQPGVVSTRVGYSGGDVPNATYRNHGTHAESIEVVYDREDRLPRAARVPAPLGPAGISGLHPAGGVERDLDGPGWERPSTLEVETMALSDGEREHLERRLKEERVRVTRILDRSIADQSSESEQDRTGDLTKVPFHLADLGSDATEAELASSNATRLSSELAAIDEALERLYRTPEDFGICQDTGVEIPLARLDIVPWARTCDEAGA